MKNYVYPYYNGDLLKNPQTYQMTPYGGENFLRSYQKHRQDFINNITKNKVFQPIKEIITALNLKVYEDYIKNYNLEIIDSTKLLYSILFYLKTKKEIPTINNLINNVIKKFEIKKRIYSTYDKKFKETSSNFSNLRNYLLLSLICLVKYEETFNLKFLNTLLKINDIICSKEELLSDDIPLSIYVLENELTHVINLCNEKKVPLK